MKNLFLFALISSILSMSSLFLYTNQNTHKAHTTQTEHLDTYTYKLTKIDSKGYYGHSTKDKTGIYFVSKNVPENMSLHVNDLIRVSFPLNSYEKITKIEKVNAN